MDLTFLILFVPLVGWALGDFFIQKTVKKVSIFQSLFYICFASTLFILPFKFDDLMNLNESELFSLSLIGVLTFVYALFQFKSMQVGKLSVVETIIGLELPLTVLIAVNLGKETISYYEIFFIFIICFGVILTSSKEIPNLKLHKHILEKGILLALAASLMSAFVNFLTGSSAQEIDPLLTILVIHFIIAILSFIFIVLNKDFNKIFTDLFKYPKVIFLQTFFDNVAWIGYAYAVTFYSISLTIAFSESYIVLAAMLGYFFNKEKLSRNQKVGVIVTLSAVVMMSFFANQ